MCVSHFAPVHIYVYTDTQEYSNFPRETRGKWIFRHTLPLFLVGFWVSTLLFLFLCDRRWLTCRMRVVGRLTFFSSICTWLLYLALFISFTLLRTYIHMCEYIPVLCLCMCVSPCSFNCPWFVDPFSLPAPRTSLLCRQCCFPSQPEKMNT